MWFKCALLLAAIPIAAAQAAPCDDEASLALDALARNVSVHIGSPPTLTIGSDAQVSLDWAVNARRVADDTPVYFIAASSAPVRFLGTGFLALTRDAAGPTGITFGQQQSRAVIPLHNPTADMRGSIRMQALRAGALELSWALVGRTVCGERIIAEGKSALSASPGSPQIVIQNPYDLEKPDQVVVSDDGRHRLHVFAERFRVFDVETGALVLEAQGRAPNLSPTGRFLAAYQGGRDSRMLDLFDLESGARIGSAMGPTLIWQNGDSVLISGAEQYERVLVLQTLVDDVTPPMREKNEFGVEELCERGFATTCRPPARLLADHEGCNGCGAAWPEVATALSVDTGIAARWHREDAGNTWKRTVYSLGFALDLPVAGPPHSHFRSDRTRVLDRRMLERLERLAPPKPPVVLADGRASHAPAADWRSGADGAARIARERAEVSNLRARLALHRIETTPAANASAAVPDDRRGQKPTPTATPAVSHLLFEQLSDVGLKLARGTILQNAVTSVRTGDNPKGGMSHTPQISSSLQPVLRAVAAVGDRAIFDPAPSCDMLDLENQHEPRDVTETRGTPKAFKPKLVVGCADGLWSFARGSTQYLLGQTISSYGTNHETIFSNTYLLIAEPGKPPRLVYLNDGFLPTEMPMYERGDPGFSWPGNIHRVNVVAQRYLILASPGAGTAHVFDVEALRPVGRPVALVDADLFQSAQLSRDAAHLLQINTDGRLTVSHLQDGQALLAGRTSDDELLLALRDGRFEGTPEGGHFVYLAFKGERGLYSFQQFDRSLKTPGIVLAALEGRPPPPVVDVVPPPAITLDVRSENGEAVSVGVTARSAAGLARVRIMLDGVPVLERELSGHDQQLVLAIVNGSGARTVAALAVDANGAFSRAASQRLKGGAPKATLRGLAVGINTYASEGFAPLTAAVGDAHAISAMLGKGNRLLFSAYDIRPPLVDAAATPDAIRANLDALVAAARPGDTIVFSFAGHGVTDRDGQLRLATQAATFDTLATASVGWTEIAAILSRAPTRVVILLDACHAGDANFDRLTKNDSVVKALLSGVRAPIFIFAASKGRELSRERDGSGVFTRALVSALSGQSAVDLNNDGLIDASELYTLIKRDVRAATGGQQTPWLARGDLLGDFPLFERLTDAKATQQAMRTEPPRRNDGKARPVNPERAKSFALAYWRGWSDPAVAPATFLPSMFADNVLFYGQEKSRADVVQDRSRYADRWPSRSYRVQEQTLKASCDTARQTCRVEGLLEFDVRDDEAKRRSTGVASFQLQLQAQMESFRISQENGNVLRRGER